MEAAFLGSVEVERCRADGVLWLDTDERLQILYRASEQRDERETSALNRLLAMFRR